VYEFDDAGQGLKLAAAGCSQGVVHAERIDWEACLRDDFDDGLG
jgi:hypothetical protein